MGWSRGRGADAVVITAATPSDEPVRLAGEISRLKGRVVVVGGVGLNVPRESYFQKELSFVVSRSYGPGRYDPEYEERGHDYPLAYVRWTEGRNLEAFLDLVAEGRVRVTPLVTHRFPLEEGERAYRLIVGETAEPYLGVLLLYDTQREVTRRVENAAARAAPRRASGVRVGLVGAGGYARSVLLPQFKAAGAEFVSVASASGLSAREAGRKFDFARFVSDAEEVLADPEVNLVVVATRHDTHAPLAARALDLGRHVFVEKPLAIDEEGLAEVLAAARRSEGRLMVGFNRRFSPHARAAREFFEGRTSPLSVVYRVNSGRIPRTHWAHDPSVGGGRIVSEVCHFVDLMQYLVGAPPVRVYAEPVEARSQEVIDEDSAVITLRFADGSNGTIAYLAEGDAALPKERVEIFGARKSFVIDDFRAAASYEGGRETRTRLRAQDKGQAGEVAAARAVVLEGREPPITLAELAATTRATFRIVESLRTGEPKTVISDE